MHIQALVGLNSKLNFENYTLEDGLSDNYINCIYQDNKGWIWVGTGMGVERFDGLKFKSYDLHVNDTSTVEHASVRKFFESSRQDLYACVEDIGLMIYNRKKDRFERLILNDKAVLDSVSVKDITEDNDGNLWAATKKGICKIDLTNHTISVFSHHDLDTNSLIDDYVRTLEFDDSSNLWVGTRSGLDLFDTSTGAFIHFSAESPLLNDEILDVVKDKENRLWIGTGSHGLIIIENDRENIRQLKLGENNIRNNTVRAIYQDRNDLFWIGTRGGLYLLDEDTGSLNFFEKDLLEEKSLIHNSILDIFQDAKGDLWISTRGGISYLAKEKQAFESYKAMPHNSNYLNNSEVYCIWIDNKDHIWLGTENGGVNILNRNTGKFQYLTVENNKLSNNCIKSIEPFGNDLVLIGAFNGGLNVYNKNTGKTRIYRHDEKDKNSISDDVVWDICVDKNNTIWIATASGLDRFDPLKGTFTHYPQFNSLEKGISWIGLDKDNDLWLGSEIIQIFRPGFGIISTFEEKSRGYYLDSQGNYWIMSVNHGVIQYDKYKGQVKTYNTIDGLSSNLTYCMLEDNANKLWISTSNGLSRFDPEDGKFKNYFVDDGLQGDQFHYGAAYKSGNGKLLFGGNNGFTIFNPQDIINNTYKPPVYITDFKISNRSVSIGNDKKAILTASIQQTETIRIPPNSKLFTFDFAALNYTNSAQNQYKYKLEGFDDEWTEVRENRSATYTNLNPGKYTFTVIASNNNDVWNYTGTSKQIIILPPYYKKPWFYFLMFLALSGILILAYYNARRIWELRKNLEFEKKEAQRLHELDNFKLQFFTNISHEIKTPLTLIISPLEKILKYDMPKLELRENLQMMHRNAAQLMQLITQLLDYRKIETGKLHLEYNKGDIVQFCHEVFLSFQNLMEEARLSYSFKSVQREIVASFDSDKLRKILDNLITNAIKYNKPGGTIQFYISLVIDHQAMERENNQFIKIVIKDTGTGIPEENIGQIFNRFFTGGNNRNSTSSGIGLAFTRELVNLLNGKIDVDSVSGKGSTFTVLLPLLTVEDQNALNLEVDTEHIKSTPENETKEKRPPIAPDQTNKRIILVVEDNKDVCRFLTKHFESEYTVYEANNGREGFDLAVEVVPNIILSDIMMPEMDGDELCGKLKSDERTSHIPIIMLTALSSNEKVLESLRIGADDYITKPFDISILQTKVDNLLSMQNALREKYSKELVLKPTSVTVTSPDERFLQKALKIAEENIDDPEFDVVKFVDKIGMSRMQLYRKMSALTNMTVKEFIRDFRLKRAYQLLTENSISVSDAAYAVGFSDISYFGKCFKKKYGTSASEILKAQKSS